MHFHLAIFSADNVFIGISANPKSRSLCIHLLSANGLCLPVDQASVAQAAANTSASGRQSSVHGQLVEKGMDGIIQEAREGDKTTRSGTERVLDS